MIYYKVLFSIDIYCNILNGTQGGIRTHGFTVLQTVAFDHSATCACFGATCWIRTSPVRIMSSRHYRYAKVANNWHDRQELNLRPTA
jgi:hypothetical protein